MYFFLIRKKKGLGKFIKIKNIINVSSELQKKNKIKTK